MQKLIDLLNVVYNGSGYSFIKEVTIPWIGTKASVTIIVTSKSPTSTSLIHSNGKWLLKFDKNSPSIKIKEVGVETSLTGILFDADKAVFQLSGFPDITYTFQK